VAARLSGVVVESGVDCFEWLEQRLPLEAPRRQLFLEGPGWEPSRFYSAVKRAGDVLLAGVGLLLAAPLIGTAALAIRAESSGPVLLGQVRVGRNGRPFRMWKLRSMRVDAEKAGPALAAKSDPRVTRVGRILRRTRIDELPQLWNVLRGDMSIVGPRPERPEYHDELTGLYGYFPHRLAVRPGLTGWAQVQQGYVNDLEGFGVKLTYDLFYLRRRSLGIDAQVMWRTLKELLQLKGV
jgi:lipopolysaccharide/colanic/teichoic acid biosynthesis glycosyltransferase